MKFTNATPHDAVFKQFLMHADTARDFLEIHLPATLREICDLSTLQLESASFVGENLKKQDSDVLYSVQMRGHPGYIHVLIEHQSSPDKTMAFRMMRYAIAAMHRHLEAGHEQLPLVIPLLFYHGKTSPYPLSLCWLDMFSSPTLAKELYSKPFPLVDITVIPDDEIMRHRRVAVLELLQKHIRQRDLMLLLERLVTLMHEEYTSQSQMITLVNYMLCSGHTDQPDIFYRELAARTPQEDKSMMTVAEWLEEQGMQKGIEMGMQEGIQKGKQEGLQQGKLEGLQEERRNIAQRLLESGMTRETVAEVTTLTDEEIKQLIR